MSMNPEFKKVWLEALRSGEFPQGRGSLKSAMVGHKGYCCLGLACLVWKRDGVMGLVIHDRPDGSIMVEDPATYDKGYGALPASVQVAAGLSDAEMEALIRLNDTARASFPAIADYIEANL